MGVQVTLVYNITAIGQTAVIMRPFVVAAPIPLDVLAAFGLRIVSDVTGVANPIIRTIILAFDPTAAAVVLPPVISNTNRIEAAAVDPAFPGVDYILPPGVAPTNTFRTPALDRKTTDEAILKAFMAVTSVSIPTAGGGYTAATTTAHFLGGLPPANSNFAAGCVRYINIVKRGRGYPVGSVVVFGGGGPNGAAPTKAAEATLVLNARGSIVSIAITDMGEGYQSPPSVTISNVGGVPLLEVAELYAAMAEGRPAKGTVTVGAGPGFIVTGVTITDRGDNYVSVPDMVITDSGAGLGATAIARMGLGRIDVIKQGKGYLIGTTIIVTPAFQLLFPTIGSDPQAQAAMFFRFLEAQVGITATTPVDSTAPLVA